MKYRIEIWQWCRMTEIYESDDIEDILSWYVSEGWSHSYNMGFCSFSVFEDGKELSFEEEHELGFD